MNSREKKGKDYTIVVLVFLVLLILLISSVTRNQIRIRIVSDSMEPTLEVGRTYFFNQRFKESAIERGSIILFENKELGSDLYTKRVIGLPGEKVCFERGLLKIGDAYLNGGKPITDVNYSATFIVPEHEFFVLGDNFSESYDSRYWEYPFVRYDDIRGILCE